LTDERRAAIEQRATRVAAGAFLVSFLAGIALFVVYAAGGHTPLEGLFLGIGFGGIAIGLTIWAKVLIREPDVIEDRPELRSPELEREKFREAYAEAIARVEANPARRRFLTRLLAGAAASLGVALLLPFRSLGEPPGVTLFRTAWEAGRPRHDTVPVRKPPVA
jgi:ubiquinol-cytochrome c reductase iron-sulfur subunit